MNNVITPAAFARSPAPPHHVPRWPSAPLDRQYDFCHVARKLGLINRAPRTIVDTLRVLVDRNGFPPPRTVRLCQGVRVHGGKAVTRRSCWDAGAVDAWLDRDLPPAAALSRDSAQREHARTVMGDRAQALIA